MEKFCRLTEEPESTSVDFENTVCSATMVPEELYSEGVLPQNIARQ